MPSLESDIGHESTNLAILAQAHKVWRDQRPVALEEPRTKATELTKKLYRGHNIKPEKFEVIREANEDTFAMLIWFQLRIVGWRIYHMSGKEGLIDFYTKIERDQHPGFAIAVETAWRDVGSFSSQD